MANLFDTTDSDLQANSEFERITAGLQEAQGLDPATANAQARAQSTNNTRAGAMGGAPNQTFKGEPERVVDRTPWFITTVAMREQNQGLELYVNPLTISWSLNQRSVLKKTQDGTVLHVWPNSTRRTFFDEPTLGITMQSGNIIPKFVGSSSGATSLERAQGLSNFYDFMQIVDSPKITADGRPNYVIINYHSNLFPSLILTGWFGSPFNFSDDAQNPHQISSWAIDFTVIDSSPRLTNNQLYQLSNTALKSEYDSRINRMVTKKL